MSSWSFVEHSFVETSGATIPIDDLSIQRGLGVFDFLKVMGNQPIFLDDHLRRFYASASLMRLQPLLSAQQLGRTILELIQKNDMPDSGIRIILTGGPAGKGLSITSPRLIITQEECPLPSAEHLTRGMRLMTWEHLRQFPQAKTTDYLTAAWLQPLLEEKGFDDALYLHQGLVLECPRANFFLIDAEDRILTAGPSVLEGITRQQILQMHPVEVRPLRNSEIAQAKAAFITSSTKEVIAVSAIDGIELDPRHQLISQLREGLRQLKTNYIRI